MDRKELRYLRKSYHKAIRDKKITSMEELFGYETENFKISAESWALILDVSGETFRHLRQFPYDMEIKLVFKICYFLDLDYEVISALYYKTFDRHGIPYDSGKKGRPGNQD